MSDKVQRSPVPFDSAPSWRSACHSLVWLAALHALGCSSQVTPDYEGEPMAVLRGALAAGGDFDMAAQNGGMTVGLVWLVGSPNGERKPLVAEVARTEGEFPFGFELTVFGPPKPEAQSLRCDYPACPDPAPQPDYQGFVAALREGADLGNIEPTDILGVSLDAGVFYFERDGNLDDREDRVGSEARRYNVPPVRGYHLYSIERNRQNYESNRRCNFNGLCVHSQVGPTAAENYFADRSFEECLSLTPDAETCTTYPSACTSAEFQANGRCLTYFDKIGREPTAAELAEHDRCDQVQQEHWHQDPCEFGWLYRHPANPLGFDAEVSIQLGAGYYEWMN